MSNLMYLCFLQHKREMHLSDLSCPVKWTEGDSLSLCRVPWHLHTTLPGSVGITHRRDQALNLGQALFQSPTPHTANHPPPLACHYLSEDPLKLDKNILNVPRFAATKNSRLALRWRMQGMKEEKQLLVSYCFTQLCPNEAHSHLYFIICLLAVGLSIISPLDFSLLPPSTIPPTTLKSLLFSAVLSVYQPTTPFWQIHKLDHFHMGRSTG